MLLLNLDEKSVKPKYLQILEQVRQMIDTRVLRPGEKLPSTRRLAEKLEIHRSTVSLAYQELWALGYIELNPGSRPRVRGRKQLATAVDHGEKGRIDWTDAASASGNAIHQTFRDFHSGRGGGKAEGLIDFSTLDMDFRLFNMDSFRSCMNRAIKKHGTALLGYGDRRGFAPLRSYIARHLQRHGISVTPDEILLTNGSQQGIDLVFRMIASPGKSVAVEVPSYDYMLPLLRFSGLKPLEIPLRHDGMDLDVLAETIEKEHPSLIYTMPNFHNPTGVSTSQEHREKLLSLCEQQGIPILEDGFEEEMKYFGREVMPIKSMDRRQVVIYCGTFSKVLFPGARIGWIAADRECVERLTAIRCYSELSSSMILHAGMHEFCLSGYYDRHISKMHRVFRKRMQTAVRVLHRHIKPGWAQWKEPNGGYLVWLKLAPVPKTGDRFDWNRLLASFGVKAAHGRSFFCGNTTGTYLRLSISTLNEEETVEGIQRLADALAHVYAGAHNTI